MLNTGRGDWFYWNEDANFDWESNVKYWYEEVPKQETKFEELFNWIEENYANNSSCLNIYDRAKFIADHNGDDLRLKDWVNFQIKKEKNAK